MVSTSTAECLNTYSWTKVGDTPVPILKTLKRGVHLFWQEIEIKHETIFVSKRGGLSFLVFQFYSVRGLSFEVNHGLLEFSKRRVAIRLPLLRADAVLFRTQLLVVFVSCPPKKFRSRQQCKLFRRVPHPYFLRPNKTPIRYKTLGVP